jgi:hypothetical protein
VPGAIGAELPAFVTVTVSFGAVTVSLPWVLLRIFVLNTVTLVPFAVVLFPATSALLPLYCGAVLFVAFFAITLFRLRCCVVPPLLRFCHAVHLPPSSHHCCVTCVAPDALYLRAVLYLCVELFRLRYWCVQLYF